MVLLTTSVRLLDATFFFILWDWTRLDCVRFGQDRNETNQITGVSPRVSVLMMCNSRDSQFNWVYMFTLFGESNNIIKFKCNFKKKKNFKLFAPLGMGRVRVKKIKERWVCKLFTSNLV